MKGKLKKSIAFLMVLVMIFNVGIAAFADETILSNLNQTQGDSSGEGKQTTVIDAVYGGHPGGPANPIQQPVIQKVYEIKYLLKETDEPIPGLDVVTGSGDVGSTIEITHPEVEGYQVLADQPISLVINEDEELNKVVVYYEKIEAVIEKPITLTSEIDGITITVSADAGVIPNDTILSARLISDNESLDYVEAIRENEGINLGQFLAFDITLLSGNGIQIQPNGEVSVSFSGVEFTNDLDEILVYHLEPTMISRNKTQEFRTMSVPKASTDGIRVNNMPARVHNGVVRFSTDHFSIYLVGTTAAATYEFYNGSDLVDTQIILNGEFLVEPKTPEASAGKKFIGWVVEGETAPINFAESRNVTTNSIIKVNAVFEDVCYVYFVYDGNVIATKEIEPNTNVDPSSVPLVVNKPGKAFSHWSTTIDGTEFDFSTIITQDTTLYAVLADRWKVTFDTQGGSALLPKYIIGGSSIGTIEATTKSGYTFKHWSLTSNGCIHHEVSL